MTEILISSKSNGDFGESEYVILIALIFKKSKAECIQILIQDARKQIFINSEEW